MEDGFALSKDAIQAWCDRNEITYHHNEELQQLGIPLPLGQGVMLRVIDRPDRNMLTLAVPLPTRIPPALIQEISKATALANSATFMGAWVLNHSKGELYFRITLPTSGVEYSDPGFKWVLDVMVQSMRSVIPSFVSILNGQGTAEQVLQG